MILPYRSKDLQLLWGQGFRICGLRFWLFLRVQESQGCNNHILTTAKEELRPVEALHGMVGLLTIGVLGLCWLVWLSLRSSRSAALTCGVLGK